MNKEIIYFAKMHPNAQIPTKLDEDAGRDVYACFDEDYLIIEPNQATLVPTGIASAFPSKYYVQFEERGSTGTKSMIQHCGVVDSGFRGEWRVPIGNYTNRLMVISKLSLPALGKKLKETGIPAAVIAEAIIYPYNKAICQAVVHIVPELVEEEVTYERLIQMESVRGTGMLGSSGK